MSEMVARGVNFFQFQATLDVYCEEIFAGYISRDSRSYQNLKVVQPLFNEKLNHVGVNVFSLFLDIVSFVLSFTQ